MASSISASRTLFSVIFEGRSGSSELIARLNFHPEIQAYPEILTPPLCPPENRWPAIKHTFVSLRNGHGLTIPSIEGYCNVHVGPAFDVLPIRGLKTRLNSEADRWWFDRMGISAYFYVVEPALFLDLAAEFGIHIIRLRRRDLVKQAISWVRGVRLSKERNQWFLNANQQPLGPSSVSVDDLEATLHWLQRSRDNHAAVFQTYSGPTLLVDYEDMFFDWERTQQRVLEFLGARPLPLGPYYQKVTDDDLRLPVSNYDEIESFLVRSGWMTR